MGLLITDQCSEGCSSHTGTYPGTDAHLGVLVKACLQLLSVLRLTFRDSEPIAERHRFPVSNFDDGKWSKAAIVPVSRPASTLRV